MKNILIFVLLSFLQSGISCNDRYDAHIKELKKFNSRIKEGNWIEEQHYKTPLEEFFQLYMEEQDTVYNILFIITPPDKSYKIGEYKVRYSDDMYNYDLLMDNDTLYYYKESKNTGHKIFTIGKYYYLFKSPDDRKKLTDCQKVFLIENMDSLKLIRGNFVPEFPCKN